MAISAKSIPLRILIIDDSPEDRAMYRRFLSRDPNQSYEFLETESGEQGAVLCRSRDLDCVLLDYRLPDMDGLDVLRSLAIGRGGTPAPVVMLTGFGDDRVDERAMQVGAQDYLVKGQITELVLRRTIRHSIERYRLLAALRENEAQTRAILRSAADAIITCDGDGRIRAFNPSAERMFGIRRAEGLGRNITDLIPDLHAKVNEAPTHRELTGHRGDGSTFPAELTTSLADTGKQRLFTAFVRDITERKRAEEKFRLAVEASPNAMMIVNRDGRITLANSQTEQMFGYPSHELIGQTVEILVPERYRVHHAEVRDGFFAEHRSRAVSTTRTLSAQHKDGHEFPVEIGLNPLPTREGDFVLASVTDITERKRAEDQHKLFLAATSHDIRNSLGVILGYAEMLGDPTPGSTAATATQRIHSLVKTLGGMMDDIVVYANLDTSAAAPFEPVEVRGLMAESVHFIEKPCARAGLALHVALPEEGTIHTDRVKLLRICQNLLGNAVRYTKQGEVRFSGSLSNHELRITVGDTGIGIPADALEHVFEPYYRHSMAQQVEPLGTGLGLANVKRFCELLHATVAVESTLGVGTTFTVVIPRDPRGSV
jgi:PAS domain S-box-containing protein